MRQGLDIPRPLVYARGPKVNSPVPLIAGDVETLGGTVYESPYKTVEEWLDALEGEELAEAKSLLGTKGELDEQTRWPRETPVGDFHESQAPMYRQTEALTAEQFVEAGRVESTLAQLRTADRELLERRWYERLTLQEIADADGSTYQAVQQRLDTAIRRFGYAWKEV